MQPIPPPPTLQELTQQASDLIGLPAVIVVAVCAVIIVAARDWRLVVASFMGLYIGLALLMTTVSRPEWAVLRILVGGLIAIMWYLSAQRAGWGGRFLPFSSSTGVQARPLSSTTLFRTIVALAVAGALLAARPRLPLPQVPPDLRLAMTWLVAYALLGLALGDEALQVGTALLMWLAGTQLLLAVLGQEVWLVWLLGTLELLIGLVTGYLMVARGPAGEAAPGPSPSTDSAPGGSS